MTARAHRQHADRLAALLHRNYEPYVVCLPTDDPYCYRCHGLAYRLIAAGVTLAPQPDTASRELREAVEYAAEASHHHWWDSENQSGHVEQDWRKCDEWPCAALAATEGADHEA